MDVLIRAATPDDAAGVVAVFNPIIASIAQRQAKINGSYIDEVMIERFLDDQDSQ